MKDIFIIFFLWAGSLGNVSSLRYINHRSSSLIHGGTIHKFIDSSNLKPPMTVGRLPAGDDLDKQIFKLALPAVLNLAILPLVGAADTFWVGRMGNALALAGQGAANQIFNSAFWIISFLPSVVTPLVAKAAGAGDKETVQERVGEAIFIGTFMGLLGMVLLSVLPNHALALVIPKGSDALVHAKPYLTIRALTFIPALLSTVAFAAFRGDIYSSPLILFSQLQDHYF